jgi:integrase
MPVSQLRAPMTEVLGGGQRVTGTLPAACEDLLSFFFISVRGRCLDKSSVSWVFRRLLKSIGLAPTNNGRRPRIHDLRHTFATRALETCPEGRDKVGRHILALSTYLGHAHVSDTYWYLEATPTLMQDIASSCEAMMQGSRR